MSQLLRLKYNVMHLNTMSFPDILFIDKDNPPQKENDGIAQKTQTVPWKPSFPVKNEAIYFESAPSYNDFFTDIFLKNQLCIIGSDCTESWPSRKRWVTDRGTPNFEFLREHFGNATAPVTKCNAAGCCPDKKIEMTVSDFIQYWKEHQSGHHAASDPCLYLKDWHFTRDFPSFHAYSPPSLLCSDWLNEFWDVRQDAKEATGAADDYRFVYMGPKDTWTPFHSDVLRSYSWSANICGQKKWIFFPPGDEELLKDLYGELIHDLRDPGLKDRVKYPHAENVLADKSIEVIQHPGEIVFVPSGWHHQVFNLEDTISINHNWVNGCSAHLTWAFLKSQTARVKEEIADCASMDGFDTQCQKILKADSGMDYIEFYNFMATIAGHRVCALDVFYQRVTSQIYQDSIRASSDDVPSIKSTQTKYNTSNVYLCLWNAALYESTNLCARTSRAKPPCRNDIETNIIVSHSDQIISCPSLLTSVSPSETPVVKGPDISKTMECDNLEYSEIKENDKSRILKLESLSNSEPAKIRTNDVLGFSESSSHDINTEMLSKTSDNSGSVTFKNDEAPKAENLDNSGSVRIKIDLTPKPKEQQNEHISELRESMGTDSYNHDLCPHWAHCGCQLAVFDLQRVLDILGDVTRQPEWKNILEEAASGMGESGNVLVEDFSSLTSRIEHCLRKVVDYLS